MILAQKISTEVEKSLRTKLKMRKLGKKQKEIAAQVTELVIANEEPENWKKKIPSYLENPKDSNQERINKISELVAEHQVGYYLASILYASKKEK
jgi:DNA integrity scanning protein DisA with diadenylate cyclase activity